MNINDKLYGFTVVSKNRIEMLGADVYTLYHDKCGARLTYLDTGDDNMTFSVSFKTLPEDSTGVFHILEHSVLCGSEKYPLKDPFVELLKGSLNTFLNAMTFQDKTMYPVSSRNKRDFYNLVGVYMDAVLHPLVIKSPNAFYQEGWHYEVDDEGRLNYNGVVYNEMKGDYSSPDSVSDRYMNMMLYEGTPYEHDSGGDPTEIVKLTYESFCEAHKKYYHPTNAELFLDGNVELSKILPLLDSFLSEYEVSEVKKSDLVIPRVTLNAPKSATAYYEVKSGESTVDKSRVSVGFITTNYDDISRQLALLVIKKALFGSNEARVKRKILDSGLCENMTSSSRDGIMENCLIFDFINVKEGKSDELISLFYRELSEVVAERIDREELAAALSFYEFQIRERDYGSTPAGVINAISVMESLLYCDDPTLAFCTSEIFDTLRSRLATDYFEKLLSMLLLDNNRRATLYLLPSDTMAEERARAEREMLDSVCEMIGEGGVRELMKIEEELLSWQESPDSDEALATIPHLTLDDISRSPSETPTDIYNVESVRVISHPIATNGIIYTELYFDISDISLEDIPFFSLISGLLANLDTEKRSAKELLRQINLNLGSLGGSVSVLSRHEGNERIPKVYFVVSASALSDRRDALSDIILEVVNETLFGDKIAIKKILRQILISSEESFPSAGHTYAMGRVRAQDSVEGTVREYYSGYEGYISLKAIFSDYDDNFEKIKARILSLLDKFITRERLTVSIVGEYNEDLATRLVKGVKCGGKCHPVCNISPLPIAREGIAIPAQVSYASRGYNILSLKELPVGSLDVLRHLVGYEYLWSEIRVKGGAYGGGLSVNLGGAVSFYSYRDPSPLRSLDVFSGVPDFLRENIDTLDIAKYVIGAIGDVESIKTPRMRGCTATIRVIKNITREERIKTRGELIDTSREDILYLADLIERVIAQGGLCVVAPRDELLKIAGIEKILEI